MTLLAIAPGLLGNDAREAGVSEPVANPVNLPALGTGVVEKIQQHIDPIEYDPRGIDLLGFRLQNREHANEVEFTGLDHFRRESGVEKKQLLFRESGKIPAEGRRIGNDLPCALLESNEDRCFLFLTRAVYQSLERKHSLSTSGAADDQSSSPAWKASAGDFVESDNSSEHFLGGVL